MSRLTIYSATAPTAPVLRLDDPAAITAELQGRGVLFERLALPEIPAADSATVPDVLADTIGALKDRYGYAAADVVRITEQTPNHPEMRAKFLAEHTHDEDESRLMLDGGGSFFLHVGAEVIHAEVEAGDHISVPAGVPHWFDMGARPHFAALRLFTNPNGWVARFTGSDIALTFPGHGEDTP